MVESKTLLQAGWRETEKIVNGVKLHVVEAGQADDPLLVLLHGFPGVLVGLAASDHAARRGRLSRRRARHARLQHQRGAPACGSLRA